MVYLLTIFYTKGTYKHDTARAIHTATRQLPSNTLMLHNQQLWSKHNRLVLEEHELRYNLPIMDITTKDWSRKKQISTICKPIANQY